MTILSVFWPAALALVAAATPAQIRSDQVVNGATALASPGNAGDSFVLGMRARLHVENVELDHALDELSHGSGVLIAYSPTLLPADRLVSCECRDVTVEEALATLLRGTGFEFAAMGARVIIRQALRRVPRPPAVSLPTSLLAAPPREEIALNVRLLPLTPRQGTVTGRIIASATQRPVSSAQVTIAGSSLGALSDEQGRYRIDNVPAGPVTVRVQTLGFATQERAVTVGSGETVVVNFELATEALSLEEIIVTGTAGGTQRRAIGNVVASIDAEAVQARVPIRNMQQLLVGRTPGVRAQSTPGQVGTGSPILIRGINSLTQGNDPIVYIDGVRMDANPRDGLSQRGGANQSRLNDVHPADIASVQIIKGPAAATLYGTEASNGVIQIITKRGQEGRPQFDFTTRLGLNWMWNPEGKASDGRCMIAAAGADLPPGINLAEAFPDETFVPGTYCMNVYENERRFHTGSLYGYGLLQSYNLAIRGGTDLVRYSSSVSRTHDVGVVDWNWDKRTTIRLNLESVLTNQINVSVNGAYISGKTRLSETSLQTSAFHGIIRSNAEHLFDARRGWAQVPPEDMRQVEARNDVDRTTLSLEGRYQPFDWLANRVVVGIDRNTFNRWILHPRYPEGADHFYGALALGQKDYTKGDRNLVTVDLSSSATLNWRDFTLQPAVGFQYYKTEFAAITAIGGDFPAVPITSVSGGAIREAAEDFVENATVGTYVQQTIGWKNRAFVTAAVRADDNSAFGVNFDAAIYPKLSATWLISEEPFWGLEFLNPLRLRAAWGSAGKQPAAFAASRLYSPAIGYLNQPALIPGAFGNPDLKPERGNELEVGFDASLLNGRVELEFTRYQRRVRDAILERPIPPSTGFTGAQIVNIGLLHAWGNEASGLFRLVQTPGFAWELDTQWTTTKNEIKDMGGLDTRFNRVGYPVQSHFGRIVLDGAIDQNRRVVRATCDGGSGPDGLSPGGEPVPCQDAPLIFRGPSQPTWQLGIGNAFTLLNRVRLYARVDGNGGHLNTHNYGAAVGHRDQFHLNPSPWRYLIQQYGATTNRTDDPLYKAGFLRLSELSGTYDLPERLVGRFGMRRGAVTLGFQNVAMLWTAQHGWDTPRDGSLRHEHWPVIVWDPDIKETSENPGAGGPQTAMPPTASAILTFRFSF